ncbi:hypothetical protein LINGRAHAP2_LOCUS18789 [Linum grandiflorum]
MASSGSASKAWGVAVSIGAVEALKDQLGFCRWNHVFRSAQQYAGRNYKAGAIFSQSSTNNSKVSSCDGLVKGEAERRRRRRRTEESLEKVMYLNFAVGAVEALKDQGFCRWNHAIRSIHQLSKNKIRSSSSAARQLRRVVEEQRGNRAEESLKTVMYLSCWGPYT